MEGYMEAQHRTTENNRRCLAIVEMAATALLSPEGKPRRLIDNMAFLSENMERMLRCAPLSCHLPGVGAHVI
jgi:hypothetical protein